MINSEDKIERKHQSVKFMRSQASKLKFALGVTPKIEKSSINYREFIPKPYKAVCLISADFEMAWASRYTKSVENPVQKAIEDGYRTRRNIPIILDICDKYNIPITWATVGHLFLESCAQTNSVKHPDLPRLPYFENEFWRFDKGDWFDYDPCTNVNTDPAWYAPDLIKDIISRETKHEIGCHTFSHIDCRDEISEGLVFNAEINKCLDIAKTWGLELKSFVHPGHTVGNLNELKKKGFRSIRTDFGDRLALPTFRPIGIWEFHNTAILDIRKEWSIDYQVSRYKRIIDRAIEHRLVCVFWFHPSFSELFADNIMPEIFCYLQKKEKEIATLTHIDYTEYLDNFFGPVKNKELRNESATILS